jgi:hypothetical protein
MLIFGDYIARRSAQLIPFRPEHLLRMELKGDELIYLELIPEYHRYIIEMAVPDFSWTVVRDGSPVAVFGVRPMWPGVAEVWMLPGVGIEKNAIALVRGARHIFAQIEQEYGVRRLQIAVRKSNYTAYKFARSVYFEQESLMSQFGPEGEDYYMMTRIR